MDTAQEALFKAMLNSDWFSQSNGNTECSLGHFGWVHNHPSEVSAIRTEFEDVIKVYGPIADEQIVGVWWASINSNGIIRISKLGDVSGSVTNMYDFAHNPAVNEAKKRYVDTVYDYIEWANESEPD